MGTLNHYTELVYKLSDILQGPLASVEILPGGLEEWEQIQLPPDAPTPCATFPFVFVERNLGIPKKILYALYMAAVSTPWHSSDSQSDARKVAFEKSNAATLVILFVNPAHQTALNTRKRLVQDGSQNPEKELALFELLTRGSPEVGKASMIWHHRRWCFRRLYGVMGLTGPGSALAADASPCSAETCWPWVKSEADIEDLPRIPPSAVRRELSLVQHTCEAYPRNYHAWAHWHFILNVCHASSLTSSPSQSGWYHDFSDAKRLEFLGTIVDEYVRLRRWVELHVSDYSAMHQLRQCEKLVDHLLNTGAIAEESLIKQLPLSGLVDHSSSLLTSFPGHESLWMYLRISLEKSPSETRSTVLEKFSSQLSFEYPTHTRQLIAWFKRTL